jgi:hypothetical protein
MRAIVAAAVLALVACGDGSEALDAGVDLAGRRPTFPRCMDIFDCGGGDYLTYACINGMCVWHPDFGAIRDMSPAPDMTTLDLAVDDLACTGDAGCGDGG